MKRTGRPPLDPSSESVTMTVRLPGRDYDEVCRLARERRESLQKVIRAQLKRWASFVPRK